MAYKMGCLVAMDVSTHNTAQGPVHSTTVAEEEVRSDECEGR